MITISGKSSGRFSPIIGEATFIKKDFYNRSRYIFITDSLDFNSLGYKGCIVYNGKGNIFQPHHIYNIMEKDKIHEGDIIKIYDNGNIDVLWESTSEQNSLFLTENCNCACIMCPQPPKKTNSQIFIDDANAILSILKDKHVSNICITGGEPTLDGENFISIIRRCVSEHPNAIIHILTNAKRFCDESFANKFSLIQTKNIIFCVSIHSSIDTEHDYIVGSDGSYIKTNQGIYNLARLGFLIEIRYVISHINYKNIVYFAEHMYNYFPFCNHYVFMCLELHGNAEKNINIVNVSPSEFCEELKKAVLYLSRRGLSVSVYNLPLCLCDESIRKFARQSISSWKNIYAEKCKYCSMKSRCCGFFSTSSELPIESLKPFTEEISL